MAQKENGRTNPVVTRNEYIDYVAVRKPKYSDGLPVTIAGQFRKVTDPRANFAMNCIEKWGMVAADIDGEDSTGRSKMRRMNPHEVVDHAMQCATIAFNRFAEAGWLLELPPYEEILDTVKDYENNND